jgi:hypothetical protein
VGEVGGMWGFRSDDASGDSCDALSRGLVTRFPSTADV